MPLKRPLGSPGFHAGEHVTFNPLKSSNIEGAHYDPATRTLTVKFKSGSAYRYHDCAQHHYDDLCKAESPGKYFSRTIRGNLKWARVK